MYRFVKGIAWPLCVSFTEVGIILFSANRLGAKLTFGLFAGTVLIGLLIQMERWKWIKRLYEESDSLITVMKAKSNSNKSQDWKNLSEYEQWSQINSKIGQYILRRSCLSFPAFSVICWLFSLLCL